MLYALLIKQGRQLLDLVEHILRMHFLLQLFFAEGGGNTHCIHACSMGGPDAAEGNHFGSGNDLSTGVLSQSVDRQRDVDGSIRAERRFAAEKHGENIEIVNVTKNVTMNGVVTLSERQKQMLCAGGLLNYTKNR